MYCRNCGTQLDDKTGLCPRCNAIALEQVRNANERASRTELKKRIIITVISVILVIAIIVTGVIFAVSKNLLGGKDKDSEKQSVQAAYATYLRETIIPEFGTYDGSNPSTNTEGVYSALFCDLNDDSSEEFIVFYSEKDNSNINFNISCYGYDEDKNEIGTVELLDTVTPSSEKDYADMDDNESRLENHKIIYTVEYDNVTYIVYEYLTWFEGYDYECHIYTIEDGSFQEVSNVFVPGIASDGTEISYSTKLPVGMDIDNSDFDYDTAESGEYIKENFGGDSRYILYYVEGGGSEFEYNTYFESVNDAVCGFFKCYGIEKEQFLEYPEQPGPQFKISHSNKSDLICSYLYYIERDYENDTETEKYEFFDYTDVKSLIADKSKESKYSPVINQYVQLIENDFYRGKSYDTEDLGEFINYELLNSAMNSDDDFKVYYCEVDLNEDGINELILASGSKDNIILNDLFTYFDGKCIRLFDVDMGGLRQNFEILNDNTIKCLSSGGNSYYSINYYKLPKNSDKLLIADSICYDGENYYKDSDKDGDFSNAKKIKKDRFNDIIASYPEVQNNYDWIEMQGSDLNNSISPEDAVGIYFDNSDEWELEPDYMPMNGYFYCFMDLDFDGVLELIVNVNDGSGRYSENSYYTIDTQNKDIKKLSSNEDFESSYDWFMTEDYPQLYKNKNDGKLYYYCSDYLRVMTGEYSCAYGFVSLDDSQINSRLLFTQYHSDAGTNSNSESDEYGYYENSNHKTADKEEYDKMYSEFFADYEKVDLSYKVIVGTDYQKMNDKQKKNELLNSYKSFEYHNK